jgi:hypothetical protein
MICYMDQTDERDAGDSDEVEVQVVNLRQTTTRQEARR